MIGAHDAVCDLHPAQEKRMSKPRARVMMVVCVLLTTAFVVGCDPPGEKESYLTVTKASRRAKSLDGETVRVRGYGHFLLEQTLVLCEPARCDCNERWGRLVLLDEEFKPADSSRFFSLPRVSISESDLRCSGDECSMTCSPFDPRTAKEFEFVGTLSVVDSHLTLENLDLQASRQRIDEVWTPIETGQFTSPR